MSAELDPELARMPWSDVRLYGWSWSDDGKDLTLRLSFRDTLKARMLTCRGAAGLSIDLSCDDHRGGPLLSWDGALTRREDGRWLLSIDFPSAGSLSLTCASLELGPLA